MAYIADNECCSCVMLCVKTFATKRQYWSWGRPGNEAKYSNELHFHSSNQNEYSYTPTEHTTSYAQTVHKDPVSFLVEELHANQHAIIHEAHQQWISYVNH